MADSLTGRTAVRVKTGAEPWAIGSGEREDPRRMVMERELDGAIADLNSRLEAKGAPCRLVALHMDNGAQIGLCVEWHSVER